MILLDLLVPPKGEEGGLSLLITFIPGEKSARYITESRITGRLIYIVGTWGSPLNFVASVGLKTQNWPVFWPWGTLFGGLFPVTH